MTLTAPLSPVRRRKKDLLKSIVLLCVFVLTGLTARTLPHLQRVLDGALHISHDSVVFSYLIMNDGKEGDNANERSLQRVIQRSNSDRPTKCLTHQPLSIINATNVATVGSVLVHPSTKICGKLRQDWSKTRPLISTVARQIEQHQTNCSKPMATFFMDNVFGMGSHFNLWSQAMCNGIEEGVRIQTHNPDWLWMDQTYCDAATAQLSPLLCYFPSAEARCLQEQDAVHTTFVSNDALFVRNLSDPRDHRSRCRLVRESDEALAEWRAGSMEFLFKRVSPIVVQEAERQIGILFHETAGVVPNDLITVHIRWGDKFWEMDLAPEGEYIAAVCELLRDDQEFDDCNTTTANIYLASEDPRAVQAFLEVAPARWKIFVDRTVEELGSYRPAKGNRASWTTKNTKGRAGLVALGSLLVSLEANDFVLTTKSNWSRLLNELRKNVLDPSCGNCTRMIDLRPGAW